MKRSFPRAPQTGVLPTFAQAMARSAPAPQRRGGRGLRLAPGELNKLEQERERELATSLVRGEILLYKAHAITLKLADDTRYTPDFFVLGLDGLVTFEETKGFVEDDALVKIKVAAAMFPFRFVMLRKRAKKNGGGWERREFKGWSDGPAASPATTHPDIAGDIADKLF